MERLTLSAIPNLRPLEHLLLEFISHGICLHARTCRNSSSVLWVFSHKCYNELFCNLLFPYLLTVCLRGLCLGTFLEVCHWWENWNKGRLWVIFSYLYAHMTGAASCSLGPVYTIHQTTIPTKQEPLPERKDPGRMQIIIA